MKYFLIPIIILLSILIHLDGLAQDFDTDISLAITYKEEGKYAEAAELAAKWVPWAREEYGENDTSFYLNLLIFAINNYQEAFQYEQAVTLMMEVSRMAKETLGENHTVYGICINNLALLYQKLGRYEQAEPIMVEATRITKKNLGENHPDYRIRLNNLAQLYCDIGHYEQAVPMMLEAARIAKETLGVNHHDYGVQLSNLSNLYFIIGRFDLAEPLMFEATRITKETLGDNHPEFSSCLYNLASIYFEMGRYEKAEPMMLEATRITKETLGINYNDYSVKISQLAGLYFKMGRYETAEPMMLEAMRITKETLGINHHDYGVRLNNLALLYCDMGRYEQAEPMMLEAARIAKETLGINHHEYSVRLSNLAYLYFNMGRYEQAEPMMLEAARIAKETLGDNHPQYSATLSNLAQLYSHMARYEQAEPMMLEAMRITNENLGGNHPDYSIRLNNLAQLYSDMGSYEQAEPMILEAMRIIKETHEDNHPDYSTSLNNLALLYQDMGRYTEINSRIFIAFSNWKNIISKNSGYLSEVELNQFLETFFNNLEIYQSLNLKQSLRSFENQGFAMDIELYQKGLLLNSVIETRKLILNSGDTSLINSYQSMIAYRKQADKLYSMPKEQRYEDPVLLELKANDHEKDLKLQSKEYTRSLEEAAITWKQVQEKLKPDEAVVEFASFGYYNKQWTDSTLYCALVLRKQDTMPHMVYLFEEKQLAEALPKLENSSDAAINSTYAVLRGSQLVPDSSWYQGENLYNLVWRPLDSLLSGIKTISYACSGLLNTVSFAAIPDATGKLLCEKYALNQYSSTRNLAIETDELPITDATIYGGIQYDLDTTLMIANSRQYSKSDAIELAYNSTRSGNKRGNGFEELEGTREEANFINALFKEKKISTHNYSGAAANEESFKAMATNKSPSVIHLSTHGFYYPDTTAQRKQGNELHFTGSDLNRFQYSPDPLLRSGIVLAGTNRAWRGEPVPDGVEDGILTAKDVSQLNLNNTQLVVLSACQTGLGDVKGSEGVFGLQRAFKMAGVRYLMMSLWSVPDKETKEFMEMFYTHWLSGKPIRQAFQNTQQKMRLQYPQEPYKWAAFILVE